MKKLFIGNLKNLFSLMAITALMLLSGCQEPMTKTMAEAQVEDMEREDPGGDPWVLDIEAATINNPHYRAVQWTGEHMQMVLMSVEPGEEIDLEIHGNLDQFIRIEQGEATVIMGKTENDLSYKKEISGDWAAFIPAGYYHNVKNTGDTTLKLYTIYAPGEHAEGTIHQTYEQSREAHEEHE